MSSGLKLDMDRFRQLSAGLERFREAALASQMGQGANYGRVPVGVHGIVADAWRRHIPGEDWLVWRARLCAETLQRMPIEVSDGELIVGRPRLEAGGGRIDDETRRVLETIPPFPGGDPGHFHPDYETVFRLGFAGMLREIDQYRAGADSPDQEIFYDACRVALGGCSDYARRVADACRDAGMSELGDMCEKLATEAPSTFHEALQLMFLVMICLWFGDSHHLTCPGRMDQTLWRFYEVDLAAGRITPELAFDLICSLYISCNFILGPGSALAVMVGGRDADGRDVTNDLTYLCLAAREATRLVYPTVGIAWHEGAPKELMDFGCRMLATGIGDPAFFNDPLIQAGLMDHGVSLEDACNYMNSTCVEIKVVGASNMWVTQPYINLPKAVLDVMEAVASGETAGPGSFGEFEAIVRERLVSVIASEAARLDSVWQERAETGCFPLASCFIHDCLERGQDFDRGGARYNWVENSFVGLANLVDGLMAVKRLVYDLGELSVADFSAVLASDYDGHEALRAHIRRDIPCYGTDNDEADDLVVRWAHFLEEETGRNIVGGHRYVPGFFCWIMHGILGAETGATPDGRRAGEPFADGAGAAQGRETAGPTASVLSTTKWDHRPAIGGLVHNVKFSKSVLATDSGLAAARAVIETYLQRGGLEMQVNVVGADALRDAQAHPENYRDLLVRVAGYSDYFTHLSPLMQEEVIARTEHAL